MRSRTSCHVRLSTKSAKLGRYVLNSVQDQGKTKNIGEHIRKRRLELRKCQKGGFARFGGVKSHALALGAMGS